MGAYVVVLYKLSLPLPLLIKADTNHLPISHALAQLAVCE